MKIRHLDIEAFRGIPQRIQIEFPVKNGSPSSMLLLGDNGVGKSSIVDALEFCLQGHVSQNSIDALTIPSIVSFHSAGLPRVKVELSNGDLVEREIVNDEQGLLFSIKHPHQCFSISPFVLRRHDILRFIDSPDAERSLVFSNYLRSSEEKEWLRSPKEELNRLQHQRLRLKDERDEIVSRLSAELKIPKDEIPFDRKAFQGFIQEHIYKGFSKKDLEARGIRVKINDKALAIAEKAKEAIIQYQEVKKQVSSFDINHEKKIFPKHLLPQLQDFLNSVGSRLTESFLEISPLNYVNGVVVEYNPKNPLALLIGIVLKNGKECSPKQLLSEANLDLLALLFFLSFVQESSHRGQSKFLVLDDVLQSVDATIRVSFIAYLLRKHADWQFIITAHDRLWHRQLTELMNANGHPHFSLSITQWSFETGPKLKGIQLKPKQLLTQTIDSGDHVRICSEAGLLLEQLADTLSAGLGTSVVRKRDDRYTIGDLWPGVSKNLKKTLLKERSEAVDRWLHLRNLLGAHYNEWAISLSLEESKSFAQAVSDLHDAVRCCHCESWISSHPGFDFISCKCGKLQLSKSNN